MAGYDGSGPGTNKFDGSDFTFWRLSIKDYLYSKKLHQPLSGKKSEKMEADELELLDRQVLGVIRLTLTKNVAHNVVEAKTTEEMMSILSDFYEKPSPNNKVHLMKKLFNLKIDESGSVAAHINEFNTIVSQLISVEINFDDEFVHLFFWRLYQALGSRCGQRLVIRLAKKNCNSMMLEIEFLLKKFARWIRVKEHHRVLL